MFLPPFARPVAYAFAKLYEFGVRSRLRLYERGWLKTYKLPVPVISIGNLTVGGTGKTPCTAYLANLLTDAGYRVAILSRGYKRTTKGIIEVSDGTQVLCSPAESGDEPYLLAHQCPGVRVVVSADRYAAGIWLLQHAEVDVFLLDDGYQHLRLHRDLNLALVDAREDLQNARLVPLGPWREPIEHLCRAEAVIVTRADAASNKDKWLSQLRQFTHAPVFEAQHELTGLRRLPTTELEDFPAYRDHPVAAFTGIAHPDKFFADLQRIGLRLVWQRAFNDHHRYQPTELNTVLQAAQRAGAQAIFTTEKDAANFPMEFFHQPPRLPLLAVQLRFVCSQPRALSDFVLAAIAPV